MRTLYELSDNVFVTHIDMSIFSAIYVGALHVGDEIVEICGISVQGRTVDYLQKMLVSILRICCVSVSETPCLMKRAAHSRLLYSISSRCWQIFRRVCRKIDWFFVDRGTHEALFC